MPARFGRSTIFLRIDAGQHAGRAERHRRRGAGRHHGGLGLDQRRNPLADAIVQFVERHEVLRRVVDRRHHLGRHQRRGHVGEGAGRVDEGPDAQLLEVVAGSGRRGGRAASADGAAPAMKPPTSGSVDRLDEAASGEHLSSPGGGRTYRAAIRPMRIRSLRLRLHLDGDTRRRIGREHFLEDGVHPRQVGHVGEIHRHQGHVAQLQARPACSSAAEPRERLPGLRLDVLAGAGHRVDVDRRPHDASPRLDAVRARGPEVRAGRRRPGRDERQLGADRARQARHHHQAARRPSTALASVAASAAASSSARRVALRPRDVGHARARPPSASS